MTRLGKLSVILILTLSSSVLTYFVISFVSETFFFDKLIYEKNIDYGYSPPNKNTEWADFGKRSQYLSSLENYSNSLTENRVLGASKDPNFFTIAVIGDSFVWGTGVKFDNTVSQLLERKLNRLRKVKIIHLAQPGNSILDYLLLYEKARELYSVDLFIFVLVDNDILPNPRKANENLKQNVWKWCQQSVPNTSAVFDFTDEEFQSIENTEEGSRYYSEKKHDEAWISPFNLCLLDKSLDALPSQKAIYLVSQFNYIYSSEWETYISQLINHHKFVIYVDESRRMKQFESYWKEPEKNFVVSLSELHPSKIMHEIYSELLFQEIVNNPAWRFK